MLEFTRITTENPAYELERELRNEVLLRPIGLPDYAWEKFDDKAIHFVAMEGNKVVGCVLLVPEQDSRSKLIQMAVESNRQHQGIGKELVKQLMNYAADHGFQTIYCDAREEVVEFYKKLGFEVVSDRQIIVGIGHYRMECQLVGNKN